MTHITTSCPWLARNVINIQAVFIIDVIVQSKITQAVNLVQVATFKMAAARVTMVILVDDVVLDVPYLRNERKTGTLAKLRFV